MRAVVTGGAGFIGHHLVRTLIDGGDDVVVVDDLSTGSRDRLNAVLDRVRFVEGSILDPDVLDDSMSDGAEVVFHLAALPSVERSLKAPRETNDVNVGGTIQVMLAAGRSNVRRVILAGSSSVYGASPELPKRETQSPDPKSPYAVSKLAAEGYLHTLGSSLGVESVSLRYFNVFGPGQDPNSQYAAVIPRFATAIIRGDRPVVNGDGSVSRDFTYVDNVVQANLLAGRVDGATGLTCNIGCGDRHTLLDLLRAIESATGKRADPVFGPERAGDVPHSHADISVARQRLGYDPSVPFAEGIRRTCSWFIDSTSR